MKTIIVRSLKEVSEDKNAVMFIAWMFTIGFWAGIALGIASRFQ